MGGGNREGRGRGQRKEERQRIETGGERWKRGGGAEKEDRVRVIGKRSRVKERGGHKVKEREREFDDTDLYAANYDRHPNQTF